jgi:hypothetical protein
MESKPERVRQGERERELERFLLCNHSCVKITMRDRERQREREKESERERGRKG